MTRAFELIPKSVLALLISHDFNFCRAEILRVVKREEQNLISVGAALGVASSSSSSQTSLLSYDRKSDQSLIDNKRKEILQNNGSVFAKLVEEVKRRKAEKASKESTNDEEAPKVGPNASKGPDRTSKDSDKTSMSVVNDGDLQKCDDFDVDATEDTLVFDPESSTNKENVGNGSLDSDDDFLTQTPAKSKPSLSIQTTKLSLFTQTTKSSLSTQTTKPTLSTQTTKKAAERTDKSARHKNLNEKFSTAAPSSSFFSKTPTK